MLPLVDATIFTQKNHNVLLQLTEWLVKSLKSDKKKNGLTCLRRLNTKDV